MKKIVFSVCVAFLAGNSLAGCSADEGSNVVNVEEYLAQFQNNTQNPSNGNNGNTNNNNNGNNNNGGNNGNTQPPTQSYFEQYLTTTFDNNRDGVLDANEIANIITLDVSGKDLTNLDGLEKLTSLAELNVSNNKLTSLEIPATLTSLISLNISGNQLTKLDVSKATAMIGGYSSLNARNNANLTCIKVTSRQLNDARMYTNKWLKETSASFDVTCN